MKSLWILNHYAVAPSESGGTRHFGLAKHLLDLGWQTSIIAASTTHQTGSQRSTNDAKQWLDSVEQVGFLWLRAPPYSGNGAGRIRNMLTYSWRALLRSTTRELPRPDVVIGSSVHPFAALSAAFLSRRFNVPFVFEVRDLWPKTLVDMGKLKANSVIARMLARLEKWLYMRADKIITVLPRAVDYIGALGIDPSKVVWIPNGVELESSAVVDERGEADKFTLMYFGAHGQANNLDNVLRAFAIVERKIPSDRISLRLIGDGPEKGNLVELVKHLGVKNVSFEAPVPKDRIPALAAEADAFIISVLDQPNLYRYGISMNKLYDYLAAARPVVIAVDAANNPVEESCGGITVPPEQPDALAFAILQLFNSPASERYKMGLSGRRYVEANYSYKKLAGDLHSVLEEVVAGRV